MTEKLYYMDSHMKECSALVTGCEEKNGHYEITLDRTVFFPEGGGQPGDTGYIDSAEIFDTHEKNGDVIHYSRSPVAVGAEVNAAIDWDRRFSFTQNHSGEHIVSGLVYAEYGYSNVGFHMGKDGVIVDFDGYISPEELADIEREANRVIWENRRVSAFFPSSEELSRLKYRSKLDLTENVRIVEIDGVDACACCAPHVKATGEVGLLRIYESSRRKNGVRIRMLAGKNAFADLTGKDISVGEISALLSAKESGVTDAVRKLIAERDNLSYAAGGLIRELTALEVKYTEFTDNSILFFKNNYSFDDLRLLCSAALRKTSAICGAFSGNDNDGYRYVLSSDNIDLKEQSRKINTALRGKGGGNSGMIQGTFLASRSEIESYFGN